MSASVLPFPGPMPRARTYGTLTYEPDRAEWRMAEMDPHVAIKLKNLFPRVPKHATQPFSFHHGPEVCADLDWFMARYPMRMNPVDAEFLRGGRFSYEADLAEAERLLLPDYVPPQFVGFRDGLAAYPMQVQAIELARLRGRLLLGDDLGLGKTTVALGAILDPAFLPAAAVVQSHLGIQWLNRTKQFTNLRVHLIAGNKPYDLPEADLYIFRYSNLSAWADVLDTLRLPTVIYDEIQELRTGASTAKYRGAQVLSRHAHKLRLALSASPVYNYGNEIFPILELIEPGALGTWDEFTREWCTFNGTKYVVKDPDALGTYLREQHLMLRRNRGGQPVNTIVRHVPYDEDVAAESEDLARALAIKVLSGTFTERGQASRELDMLARQVTGVAKARHVANVVRILLSSGTPVILAGWHREVYEIWQEALKEFAPLMYTGTETPVQKERNKQRFIDGESDLLIISLRSGAGLDGLQARCSTVVIGELDWSPKVHEQLIGRVDRPGQTADEVTAIYLVTDQGSDPVVTGVLGLKGAQARGITDPLAGVEHVHSDESRVKLLAERYLAANVPAQAAE
ncbi:SNF2-related protein [Methylobacterium sp. D53M]